jgi:hypothetical protein
MMSYAIECDMCGKEITNMNDSETYCYHCFLELEAKISDLEDDIKDLQNELDKLNNI